MKAHPPRRGFRRLAVLALLFVTYLAAGKLGLQLAYLNASATPVWAPSGIALAALLLRGYGLWPAIFLGAFLVNLTTAGGVVTSIGIAAGNTAEAVVGAYLVNRYANGRRAMERPRDIFKFALLAGGLSTMVSATMGVLSLRAGGLLDWSTAADVGATWWLGDLVGDVMVAPFVLLWSANPRLTWTRGQGLEAAVVFVSIVLGGIVVFGGLFPSFALTFLCLPLLLWPAFRFGPREAATAAVILAGIAVSGTLRSASTLTQRSVNEALLLLQGFMGVSTLTTVAVAAVVDQRRRLEAKLAHLADYDSLTDVLTRRRFEEELAQQLAKALRYETPGALLYVDLDGFKAINDQMGHGVGDRVLVEMAALLRARLRDSDIVGRLGGDEFGVLLPRADGPQAQAVARHLLNAIQSHQTLVGGKAIGTGASIGIALMPEHGDSVEKLLSHADAAMYRAKGAGRNLFRVHIPERG